jgi:hypothetical protein
MATDNVTAPDPLTRAMGEMLGDCLDHGFVPPLYVSCVAVNGSVYVARFTEEGSRGLEAEPWAEHFVGEGLMLPINVMISDTRGEAARMVIAKDGKYRPAH